jgi:uncharacterized protein (TIGR04222 family)
MDRPRGLSGPEFLEIYWIALAVATAFALFVRLRLRAGRSGESARSLDIDEMAYLAGGPKRVVEAAVARLIEVEALRPSRRGTVQATGTVVAQNAVDRAVLADASRRGRRTVNLLVPAVSRTEAVTGVGNRLIDLGLLVAPETAKSLLRLGVVPLGVVFAVGLVRWVNGLRIGAPVGWLTLQLMITAVLAVLLVRHRDLQRTSEGDRVLQNARAGERTGGEKTSPDALLFGGASGLVALGGLTAHPDLAVRSALLHQPAVTSGFAAGGSYSSSYSGCSTGSSCSSGSSCGAGGCGGGGS